jgi:amidophosphoribosyltransferase
MHFDFGGELFLGHLRYGTSGGYNLSACHPYFRRSPWATRNLALCGNFNLTNTAELNQSLIAIGQHPVFATDTQAILEKIGFFLDEEHEDIYRFLSTRPRGRRALARISEDLDLARVLTRASQNWDGGYVLCGLVGNGDAFVARDPSGIRPCHWFQNDEVVAFASERAPLMTVFDLAAGDVKEVQPGHVVVIKRRGTVTEQAFTPPLPRPRARSSGSTSRAATTSTSTGSARRSAAGWPTRCSARSTTTGRTRSSASSPTRPRSPTTA